MNKTILAAAGAAAALMLSAGAAQAQIAVGANIGTTGVGLEAQMPIGETMAVRGSLDYLKYDHDDTYDDVAYTGELDFATGGVFLDWHPGGGAFFLSGGAYFGKRDIEIKGTPTGNVEIGDTVYTPAQVGTLTGSVEMSDLQPFAGLGFDSSISRDSGWGFRGLLGASFSDDPDVTLTCSGGSACSSAAFQADLDAERQSISDDADDFKIFPVVQVGVTYKY